MHIGWHIAGDDRKYRIQHGLILSAPYLFLVAGAYGLNRYHLYDFRWLVVGIGAFLIVWLLTFANHLLFQYPNRSYELTEYGLTISMGALRRSYRWDEFAAAYLVGMRHLEDPIRTYVHKFKYDTIYLKKKKKIFGFVRSYVVLYIPADKLTEARYHLGVWVGEKEPSWLLDFGPINFEFR
jgi:hypothetical protein